MSGDSSEQSPGVATGQADATGEFFSVGAPLHAVRAGYIRRRADDLLYEAAVAGRYAHIIAPDRSGKSSLIAATAARLENNGVNVAVLDLEQIGVRDSAKIAGRWYYNLAYRLLRQLRIRYDLQTWWQDKSNLSNRQRMLEFYSEVILENSPQQIVVFVDEVQCVAELPFADQLLTSIRSAHNARVTDPEFSRLTFVLLGECDPLSMVNEPELSPFGVTQAVPLEDFSRRALNLFATELNLDTESAQVALDRIYHWTRGQPYLTQKLARAIARVQSPDDIADRIDKIVVQQLSGRAALHSEPHMSHIHRQIIANGRDTESLLNLYGRIRIGINVPADLGSREQRRLMAVGLLDVDEAGELRIKNRIYAAVFTARWANENLRTSWRVPAIIVAVASLIVAIPLWYTQWLPRNYVSVLTASQTELVVAKTAWSNLRSFPGHADSADNVYRAFLQDQALHADDPTTVAAVAELARELPDAGMMPEQLLAEFWDRRAHAAMRDERRDTALFASLQALILSTPQRRNRSAMLVGDDYPLLLGSLSPAANGELIFDSGNRLLTSTSGARISQWSIGPQGVSKGKDWRITALEVTPLVRRVVVDRDGVAGRIGLKLNISHSRMADLKVKLIAPSGRAVQVEFDRDRASNSDDIRIPSAQFLPLVGEPLRGAWSISIRDEAIGVAGHLVGWNLSLNSQGLIEDFQRGLTIADPAERETEQFWVSDDGRYAVARATQSDSARLWDLAFAKPVAAIAVGENEQLVGLDDSARRLVTATHDSVHLWDTVNGNLSAVLEVGRASHGATLTRDGRSLFVQNRSDVETRLELWRLDSAAREHELVVAGAAALISLDDSGSRVAIADYDRAVRIWDIDNGEMLAQVDLPQQPSEIQLNAAGTKLGVVFGTDGVSLWSVDRPQMPMLEEFGSGLWQLAFSATGARIAAGRPSTGYQLYETGSGRRIGSPLGLGQERISVARLAFSKDEDMLLTALPNGGVRFWQLPLATVTVADHAEGHAIWARSGDSIVAALPDASALAIADRTGHVHMQSTDASVDTIATASEDVSFLGHNDAVRALVTSPDGRRVASVAADNSIRVWNAADGQPMPFSTDLRGTRIDRIAFSANAGLLGVLAGTRVAIVDANTGDVITELDLGALYADIAFGPDETLYLAGDSGSLEVITSDARDIWSARRLWQGDTPIRWLEVSPNGRFLVHVDQNNRAQQFNLSQGQPAGAALQLPGTIEDVVFSPSGSRVLFRSARWVHRAGSSTAGLNWMDSLLTPRALNGSRIVFGDTSIPENQVGGSFYLPVSRDGLVHLAKLRFDETDEPGLFGNRESLISNWKERLSYTDADFPR